MIADKARRAVERMIYLKELTAKLSSRRYPDLLQRETMEC